MNKRNALRLRIQMNVSWSIPDQQVKGEGKTVNVSILGILLETDKLFEPEHGLLMCFSVAELPFFPAKGKLAWFKKAGESKDRYQCGVRFVKDLKSYRAWVQWMEENISKMSGTENNKILDRYLNQDQ